MGRRFFYKGGNMYVLRLSTSFRLCLLAVATWLVLGAPTTAVADSFADVIGVPGCVPNISHATPAVVFCGIVGLGRAGFASASANALGASASSGSTSAIVDSIAQFTDLVTFSPTGTGTGFLGFRENLVGTITGAGGGAQALGQFSVSYNDTIGCIVQTTQNGPFNSACIAFVPVTFGKSNPVTLFGSLEARAKFGTFTVTDFSHTAMISAVDLYNANKKLIGPVELIGSSGATYGSAPSPTPEPASLLLFATGLLGLAGAARAKWLR
jgi:hypothetical protein